MPSYNLMVQLIPDGEIGIEQFDYNELINKVDEFVRVENEKSGPVLKIVLPCEIVMQDTQRVLLEGRGDPNLWHVWYRKGNRWPSAVYDAVNNCFLQDLC